MQEYYDVMEALGRKLMRAFALALGLEEAYFDRWLNAPMTTLGPLHYPPQKRADYRRPNRRRRAYRLWLPDHAGAG